MSQKERHEKITEIIEGLIALGYDLRDREKVQSLIAVALSEQPFDKTLDFT